MLDTREVSVEKWMDSDSGEITRNEGPQLDLNLAWCSSWSENRINCILNMYKSMERCVLCVLNKLEL